MNINDDVKQNITGILLALRTKGIEKISISKYFRNFFQEIAYLVEMEGSFVLKVMSVPWFGNFLFYLCA